MDVTLRSLLRWILAGAGAGATAFLAAAAYVIYMEVYYRCDSERCHSLQHAVDAVLAHTPVFGGLAVLGGGLLGLAVGLWNSRLRRP
jgi:hypothetical protein